MPDNTTPTQPNLTPPRIVSVGQALQAMRNAPYTTESALAELMDNSIQAKASYIAAIISEGMIELPSGQLRRRLETIGIFDNGKGMDAELIQNCLSVGFSRNREDPMGLGKFGYGMLIGSLSQCFRVEVYSWQENKPIYHTYIDIPELLETKAEDIPAIREVKSLPLTKKLASDKYFNSPSGTLVLLTKLEEERIGVVTGSGLYNKMKEKLGRIYRHYLDDDDDYGVKRKIQIVTMDHKGSIALRHDLIPNDPMFLLTPNILPNDFGRQFSEESTNMLFEDPIEMVVKYEVHDAHDHPTGEIKESIVTIKSSFIRPEVRDFLNENATNAGATNIGRIYDTNTGISFMRAAREIKLDRQAGFVNTYEPTERWWGIEIRFDPCLDKVFGVSADKQHIQNIFPITPRTPRSYHESAEDSLSVSFNIELNSLLKTLISQLRLLVKKSAGTRGKTGKGDKKTIEIKADEIIKKDKTTPTKSEKTQKEKSSSERLEELRTLYEGLHPDASPDEIEKMAKESMERVIEFAKDDWAGSTFLDHKPMGMGSTAIINTRSKFYKHFYEVLEDIEDATGENALKLLLMAYVRTEDELSQKHDPEGELFDEFRDRWGHWVNELLPLVDD